MLKLINYEVLLPDKKIVIYEKQLLKKKLDVLSLKTRKLGSKYYRNSDEFQNEDMAYEAKQAFEKCSPSDILSISVGRKTDTVYIVYSEEYFNKLAKKTAIKGSNLSAILLNGAVILALAKYKRLIEFDNGIGNRIYDVALYDEMMANDMENKTFKTIYNMLIDANTAYYLELNFPELSKFAFVYMMSHNKRVYTHDSNFAIFDIDNVNYNNLEDARQLYVNTLAFIETFCKYQIIDDSLSEITYASDISSIVNTCFPFLIISKRKEIIDCYKLAALITDLLQKNDKLKHTKNGVKFASVSFLMQTAKINRIGNRSFDSVPYESITSFVKSNVSEDKTDFADVTQDFIDSQSEALRAVMKKSINKANSIAKSINASLTKAKIEKKNGSTFFLQTIEKYKKQIVDMEKMFKKVFTKIIPVNAFDGDVNFKMQQLAYLSSKTNESAKVYNYQKKELVDVDIIILRDISGSTDNVATEYAESVIMFLSAVNRIPGIRTMQIDYNDNAIVNKNFADSVDISCIYPAAVGGTDVTSAYKIVMKQRMKGKLKLMFVISDGDTFDKRAAKQCEETLNKMGVEIIKYAINGATLNDYKSVNVRDLHKEITAEVLKRRMLLNV